MSDYRLYNSPPHNAFMSEFGKPKAYLQQWRAGQPVARPSINPVPKRPVPNMYKAPDFNPDTGGLGTHADNFGKGVGNANTLQTAAGTGTIPHPQYDVGSEIATGAMGEAAGPGVWDTLGGATGVASLASSGAQIYNAFASADANQKMIREQRKMNDEYRREAEDRRKNRNAFQDNMNAVW